MKTNKFCQSCGMPVKKDSQLGFTRNIPRLERWK